ncbi:ribonuclease H-like domain-containing protein [Tanacetum coccineum]
MAEFSQKWHNGTSSKTRSTETSDGLAAIQAQLNNLRREITKVNEKVYAAQMSKVLQERGFGSQPSSTETNPRDQVKSISTAKADLSEIHRTEPNEVKILEAYDHTLPQKEKDLGSFTSSCFIHNVCFDKALVDLRASVSVMPFSTYTNLGLGILTHTRLTIELADRTIKQPKGIAENVLVRLKIYFPDRLYQHGYTRGFTIINEDDVVKGVVLGMPFFKKYMSCQMIMKKFANGDENERIMDE